MPKQIPETELDPIASAVAGFPLGASIDDIAGALNSELPRRTMQRRLALLVKQKRLIRLGRGPATRYALPEETNTGAQTETADATTREHESTADLRVPFSSESESIRKLVQQPVHLRKPVGYDRSFLDAYRPNKTFYLPDDMRKRLLELGKSDTDDHPAGTHARKILNWLLIDLSWNSSRLEGNTYSLLETRRLLQQGKAATGKHARDTQMILNHKAAIEMLVENPEEVGFDRFTILNLHALLANNLLGNPAACGRLRHIGVGIGGTVFYPLGIPQLIEEGFLQILHTANAITDPLEQSFFVMVHMPYLQPFEDVNKRVSRLAANLPLIRRNLNPLSFVDVPKQAYVDAIIAVYELNRVELLRDVFAWAYERSCARYADVRQMIGEPDPFRLRYREQIMTTVGKVVRGKMDIVSANAFIDRQSSQKLPEAARARFCEVVATELMALHEGNIARYRLRPMEFQQWQEKSGSDF